LARVKTLPALMLAAAGVGFGHAVMPDHWMPLAVLSRTQRYSTRRTVRLSLAAGVTHVLVSLVLGAVLVVVGLQFRGTVSRHTDVVIGGVLLVTGLVFVAMEMVGRGHRHDHDDNHHHDNHNYSNDNHSNDNHSHNRHNRHNHSHSHDSHSRDSHSHDSHSRDSHNRDSHSHSHDSDNRDSHNHDHDSGNHNSHNHDHDHDHSHHSHQNQGRGHHDHDRAHPSRSLAAVLVPFGAAASPDLTILPVFLAAGAVGVVASISSLIAFAAVTVGTMVGLTTATAAGAKLLTAPWIDRGANLLTAGTLLVLGVLVAGGVI